MKHQPQPPEPRVLHDVTDPSSVLREAEVPYGSVGDADLTLATRNLLMGLKASDVPHLLVGAMAMLQHLNGRPTRDIDLIMARDDLDNLPCYRIEECDEWFATGTAGPVRINLLLSANPLFAEVLANHAATRLLMDTPIRCATPRGILILKLYALPSLYRGKNVCRAAIYETDIVRLLTLQPADSESLLATLQPHMPSSEIKALRQVLTEIQQRTKHRHLF